MKCRTSSLGNAVMASAKCVIAGKISTSFSSPTSDPDPRPRPFEIEGRAGFVRACRRGWARLFDEESPPMTLEVFIASGRSVGDCPKESGRKVGDAICMGSTECVYNVGEKNIKRPQGAQQICDVVCLHRRVKKNGKVQRSECK